MDHHRSEIVLHLRIMGWIARQLRRLGNPRSEECFEPDVRNVTLLVPAGIQMLGTVAGCLFGMAFGGGNRWNGGEVNVWTNRRAVVPEVPGRRRRKMVAVQISKYG